MLFKLQSSRSRFSAANCFDFYFFTGSISLCVYLPCLFMYFVFFFFFFFFLWLLGLKPDKDLSYLKQLQMYIYSYICAWGGEASSYRSREEEIESRGVHLATQNGNYAVQKKTTQKKLIRTVG